MTYDERSVVTEHSSFLRFALVCEDVRCTSSKLKKIKIVAEYLSSLKSDEDLKVATTFLASKIFSPGLDERELNVGYSLIWRAISHLHSIGNEHLSNYYIKHGDLGSAVEDYLNSLDNRVKIHSLLFESELSMRDVYGTLMEIARASGKGSTKKRQRIVERLLSSLQIPTEAKYLVRIMGGEMRMGLVEGLVEESVARAFSKTVAEIRTANLVTGDIGMVAVLARHDKIANAKLELFRPTNFMLADSAPSAREINEKFQEHPLISDYKYDGIRAQIHAGNGRVKIFSRNLEDITQYFPEIEDAAKRLDSSGLIMDGEIVPFKNGRPLAFQALQRRLRKLEISAGDVPVKFFAFDLLYLRRSMIEKPLSDRIEALHALGLRGVLDYSEQRSVGDTAEIQTMFEESKSLGYEGLVVKAPSSPYVPGRRGNNWVKLKKELDTLDVVIVAAEYGHGKRAGLISDYTFAVRDCDQLKIIGKAYSGLTDSEISGMTHLLKEITLEDRGYIRTVKPEVVLEIAFDAIQRSNRHNSGFALRFPRIKRIRTDKPVSQIDTIGRVREIYERQTVKC